MYDMVAARHVPRDALGREVVALCADMLGDYRAARMSKKTTASARRKLAGLLLGALRAARDESGEERPSPAEQLAAVRRAVEKANQR